ncbi:MAG: M10 family metallopeptidase C-terminal domain-containing protein [Pseudomonadota bacterium]
MMCSYNPVCAVDGTHKTFVETESLSDAQTFEDVTFSTIPSNTSTGASISVGQTVLETLETNGDRDWFRIELEAGQRVTIELDGVNHSGSSLGALADPYVRLYSSNGSFVTGNDDGGPGRNSNLTFTAQSGGTYYIEAAAWNDGYSGDYRLEVSAAAPITAGTLQDLSDFLVSGYWSTPRYWNLGSTGPNAQNGVLTYTLDGFSEDSNGLTAARAELVREAFKMYEAVLGIDFQETSSQTADFRFKDNDSGAYAGSSYSISGGTGFISSSRINVAASWNGGSTSYDSYTFQTILHEIGHALGLGHQGGYNGSASYANDATFENDSWQASMMSYFSQTENTSISASNAILISPMSVDWLALDDHYAQYGFGVSNAFTGNTVWGFNTNISASTSQVFHDLALYANDRAFTIIDSGGNDTIDFSGYSQNQRIDLTVSQANSTQATTSDIGFETQNLTLAVGTVIENAKSGGGNDQLVGNEVNNSLYGGGGNDTLEGKGGNDYLDGGSGSADVAIFTGNLSQYDINQISSNQFTVTQTSGAGSNGTDTLLNIETARFSNTDIDLTNFVPIGPVPITGDNNANTLTGDSDANEISGLGGNDVLNGQAGNDTLFGGSNNDVLYGGAGDDSLDGGGGNDEIIYDAADSPSRVTGGSGTDTLVVLGSSVPFGYNLSAGSFELARHEEQGTSGQNWDSRSTIYSIDWLIESRTTQNSDGSRTEETFDAGFLDSKSDYNANNELAFLSQINSDGSRSDTVFDVENSRTWTSLLTDYDPSNTITLRRYIQDNGERIDFTYDVNSTNSWTQIQTNYDASGNVVLRRYSQDNGERIDFTYDVDDSKSWTQLQTDFDTFNNITLQRYSQDNGERIDFVYDVDGSKTWDRLQTDYDAANNVTLRRYFQDNGERIDFVYDVADTKSWERLQTEYDDASNIALRRYFQDDGQRIDFTYDVDNVHAWDVRTTTYDEDGNIIDDVFV